MQVKVGQQKDKECTQQKCNLCTRKYDISVSVWLRLSDLIGHAVDTLTWLGRKQLSLDAYIITGSRTVSRDCHNTSELIRFSSSRSLHQAPIESLIIKTGSDDWETKTRNRYHPPELK